MRTLLLLTLVASACASPTAPEDVPAGAVAIGAPTVYADWYRSLEGCAGRDGRFGAIRWYVVPNVNGWESDDGGTLLGLWVPPDRIYVAEGQIENGPLVRHEMLHHILQRADHPRPPFGDCEWQGAS